MMMTPEIATALSVAVQQWSEAQRALELAQRVQLDAYERLKQAERDLHELGRAVALMTVSAAASSAARSSSAPAPAPAELVTDQASPATVTMPVVPTDGVGIGEGDAAQIVLHEMMHGRIGGGVG